MEETPPRSAKKRERPEPNSGGLRYEAELQRCRTMANSPSRQQRAKRTYDEPGLTEALKRTRISCAPGELRLKNDVAALERSGLVRSGEVGVACLGAAALVLSVGDERFLVTVSKGYPFEPPSVRQFHTGQEPELALLTDWSAVYSLEDVANALFERSQVRGLFRYELTGKKPPILSSLINTALRPPPEAPPPPMPPLFDQTADAMMF